MKNHLKLFAVVFLVVAFALSACTMAITGRAKVDQASFNMKKKYALVSISSAREIAGEQGFFQQFKKNENIEGINTQPIIDELVPTIRAKFAQTGYFTSVPMRTIVNSRSYKKLAEDEKIHRVGIFKTELNVARGYKHFSDKEKLVQLAKDLQVDGVFCVNMHFSVKAVKSKAGAAVSSLLGGVPVSLGKKSYSSSAGVSVVAYDAQGNMIWEDTTVKEAEPGDKKAIVLLDISDVTGTDFEKMHPSAVLVGSHAVDVLVQRFKDTIEGKKTGIFQKVKDKDSREATKTKT